jgi:hypothetical protein
MEKENIFKKIPPALADELFENILEHGSFKLERIVSRAYTTPQGEWYDQEKTNGSCCSAGPPPCTLKAVITLPCLHREITFFYRPISNTGLNGQPRTRRPSGWPCIINPTMQSGGAESVEKINDN